MKPTKHSEFEKAFERECKAMARGGYKNPRDAVRYVEKTIGKHWRQILQLDVGDSIVAALGLTETQCLIIHLFGRGVLQKGKTEVPVVRSFVPVNHNGAHLPLRAVPQRLIGHIIARSKGQVRHALDGFRGKSEPARRAHALLLDHGLVFPLFVPTGIMLDVSLSRQRQFAFMEPDYEFAKWHATKTALDDRETQVKQIAHCDVRLSTIKRRTEESLRRHNDGQNVEQTVEPAKAVGAE